MVRGKYTLGRGLGPSQENVSVPLSKHIYSSVLTGRQGHTLCHNLKLQLVKNWGRSSSPSRLNPDSSVQNGYLFANANCH